MFQKRLEYNIVEIGLNDNTVLSPQQKFLARTIQEYVKSIRTILNGPLTYEYSLNQSFLEDHIVCFNCTVNIHEASEDQWGCRNPDDYTDKIIFFRQAIEIMRNGEWCLGPINMKSHVHDTIKGLIDMVDSGDIFVDSDESCDIEGFGYVNPEIYKDVISVLESESDIDKFITKVSDILKSTINDPQIKYDAHEMWLTAASNAIRETFQGFDTNKYPLHLVHKIIDELYVEHVHET